MLAAGCPTRDISKLDPSPAIEYEQKINVNVNRQIDILFVIDNSDSMKEEQDSLAANFPRFIDVLSTIAGGLPDVHIAVVSSDVGIPPYTAEACSENGDDGLMQNTAHPPTGGTCSPPRNGARYIEDVAGAPGQPRIKNYDGDLDDVFGCIARLGNSGCGVEQHLESMRRALDGRHPENGGFLRPDAYLAVIILADEDDCSARDTNVFNPATQFDTLNSMYGPFSSFRCAEFGITCDNMTLARAAADYTTCMPRGDSYLYHPDEYVGFLRQLKGNPNLVVTSIISGNPTPVGTELTMTDPNRPAPRLKPSCISTNGRADPGVRLKYFGDQQGSQNLWTSICQADLTDSLKRIAELLGIVLGTRCLRGPVDTADIDAAEPGVQLDCNVADVRFRGTPTQEETTIPRFPMTGPTSPDTSSVPCWWAEASTVACENFAELHVERGAANPPIGTEIVIKCVAVQ